MILVVGATGLVGSEVCRRLAARGEPVRALVRASADSTRVRALRDAGVEIVVGDLRDRASLRAACVDISSAVETAEAMPHSFVPGLNDLLTTDLAGVESLIDTAAAIGVAHFVYLSVSGHLDLDFPYRRVKRQIEAHLQASGMTYTILRPSSFMEAWLAPAVGFDAAGATAVVYGDGTRPISWVAAGDVAELTVRCLRNPAARDAIIEMGGPEPLTPLEAIRIFEEVGGRRFTVRHVPVEELIAEERAATDDVSRTLAALKQCYAAGDPIPMEETARTFGIHLTSVRDFAEATYAKVAVPVA
jgi:uncharacterized protein YbjT (DUF2867 family)